MTKYIDFTKMHGAGNDYIYVNMINYPLENPEEIAIKWSRPHVGIGSDGLVLINKSSIADFHMRIFNADGSEALMCGNATRCIGKYVYESGLTQKDEFTLETLSGIKTLKLIINNGEVTSVSVDMGKPVIENVSLGIEVNGQFFTGSVISMGNPHFVIFTEFIDDIELKSIGPIIENLPIFPNRINVEFVQVVSQNELRMRVWERGSGITQACGTGACASAVAAIVTGKSSRQVSVIMDGGTLAIDWNEKTGTVWMSGNAVNVFEGRIKI